jgi:hypothetical protein
MPSSHRSGSLKQSNKGHKSSVASKRALSRGQGAGKVNKAEKRSGPKGAALVGGALRKNRANEAQQSRDKKRQASLQQRRVGSLNAAAARGGPAAAGGASGPPKIVGVVCLSEGRGGAGGLGRVSEDAVRAHVLGLAAANATGPAPADPFQVPQLKGHLQLLTPLDFAPAAAGAPPGALPDSQFVPAALELARVCDVLVLAFDGVAAQLPPIQPQHASAAANPEGEEYPNLLSTQGERVLTALKSQGLPQAVGLLLLPEGSLAMSGVSKKNGGLTKGDRRKIDDLRKYTQRFLKGEMGDDVKVVEEDAVGAAPDAAMAPAPPAAPAAPAPPAPLAPPTPLLRVLVSTPPSPVNFSGASPRNYMAARSAAAAYDAAARTLSVSGFLRGRGALSVNGLVHVSGMGTFRLRSAAVKEGRGEPRVLTAVEGKQEEVERFAKADALDGEQVRGRQASADEACLRKPQKQPAGFCLTHLLTLPSEPGGLRRRRRRHGRVRRRGGGGRARAGSAGRLERLPVRVAGGRERGGAGGRGRRRRVRPGGAVCDVQQEGRRDGRHRGRGRGHGRRRGHQLRGARGAREAAPLGERGARVPRRGAGRRGGPGLRALPALPVAQELQADVLGPQGEPAGRLRDALPLLQLQGHLQGRQGGPEGARGGRG